MNKRNYQAELDNIIKKNQTENKKPTLLLHACCAPCSSYVLEYLVEHFKITLFFYNPNITSKEEFDKRVAELYRFIDEKGIKDKVNVIVPEYDNKVFFDVAKGLENEPERGKRCYKCYKIRLEEAGRVAQELGSDYFTTTLSISPHKNADWLNEIGENFAKSINTTYLVSDFKKKNGYKRSIELSKEYNLYRQDFCGCIYSKIASENANK